MRKESIAAKHLTSNLTAFAGCFLTRICWLVLLGVFAGLQPAAAQQRTIVNPSFESNNPNGNPGFQFFANAVVPGWDSTNGTVELWDC